MENQQVSAGNNKPWAAYNIIKRPGLEKPIWSRVGSAFKNHDGSWNIYLDAFPVGGKVQIRPDDREEKFGKHERGALATEADA